MHPGRGAGERKDSKQVHLASNLALNPDSAP